VVFVARASGLVCGFLLLNCPLQQICGAEKSPSPMETFMLQRGYRPIHAERNVANQFLIRGKLNGARCVFDVDTGAACTLVDVSKATQLKRVTSLGSLRGAFGFEAKDVPVVAIDCMDLGGTIISNQLMGVLNLHRDRTVYTGSYIPRTGLSFQIGAREVLGTVRDIGANRAELRYATIRSLKIGAYEQQNFHAAVDELQFLKPKPGQVPPVILGLLGPDLLGKAQALIDCSRAKLYLKPLPSK